MKLLLDQGLPRSSAAILREKNIDAIHVGDIGHSSWEDATILKLAHDEGHIIATLDADFHTLLALSNAKKPSVIRIRIEGLRGEAIAKLLQVVLEDCARDLQKGALLTVQKDRIRIRLLPIIIPQSSDVSPDPNSE